MTVWLDHVEKWRDCQRCPLGQQRSNICLARGVLPCDVLFIGEAPGVSEDTLGQPFVGPAGHRLDQIVERSVSAGMTHAMTNLVACFPRDAKTSGHNEPERSEILECQPRIVEFVNLARPRMIVCVGSLAAQYINHGDTVRCVDIIHPAAIMRMPIAQQQMATQKCIVQIRSALDDMLSSSGEEFQLWGVRRAEFQSTRDQFRDIYGAADAGK